MYCHNDTEKSSNKTSICESELQESTALITGKERQKRKVSWKTFVVCIVATIIIVRITFGIYMATSPIYHHKTNVEHISLVDTEEVDGDNNNNNGCTNSDIDCNGNGICILGADHNICRCDIGYTTHNAQYNTECNYKQKYQIKAFLLQLFLGPTGASRFYIGDDGLGALKLCFLLMIFVSVYCICCCGIQLARTEGDKPWIVICPMLILIGCAAVTIIWDFVDTILFLINDVPDSNGVALAPW
eukprot:465342_1